jgi:subtilisin family serine protease
MMMAMVLVDDVMDGILQKQQYCFDGVDDDHGTHVAGTIGAVGGMEKVAGVVWNVKMLNAKFFRNRWNIVNAIKAVDYFTDLKTRQGKTTLY